MYFLAYALILAAFLCSLGTAAWIALLLLQGRPAEEAPLSPRLPGRVNVLLFSCLLLASGILARALAVHDFSVVYVAAYTDRLLPLFYRLTAFWGGQDGSLLFWAFSVAIFGLIFQFLPGCRRLSAATRLWFWLFYFTVTAFFCLLLTTWCNPFAVYAQAPADGRGLNPLLQNPGMIFHPPLLFLGYGGFTIPGCLALAQASSRNGEREISWAEASRPFILTAWALLTAGIALGAWWSYMELGWGGYWAWDPVENASLIPWLVATAALHTLIIQARSGKLPRVNILLMALTTISAFFATYLVRSGVVQSLHAFGESGVGLPLLVFVLLGVILGVWCAAQAPRRRAEALAGPGSREGLLLFAVWAFLALAAIILLATLAPVISSFAVDKSIGLDAGFYNTACLPLFALLAALLAACPWLRWNGGVRDVRRAGIVAGVVVASGCAFLGMGYTHAVAVAAMASSLGVLLGSLFLLARRAPFVRRSGLAAGGGRSGLVSAGGRSGLVAAGGRSGLVAAGVHLGLALAVLGVAFSGPYKVERQVVLSAGEETAVGPFAVRLDRIRDGETPAYGFVRAELAVTRRGASLGQALPERRHYFKWNRTFAEASTVFSLGNEFYASLLAVSGEGRATLLLSANPLINWVWIGSALMCLFPLAGLGRRRGPGDAAL